ncbi:hypothetical protein TRIUR3_26763 [Triticum urartu]|uniref:Uncharacterized protein n=1 Tax=Triticum urartu TaxID=4572 RepID=M7ZTV5_TRIUA|nr:hypothetical protein TRIUR3_26763 [Triticum urartu]
MSEQVTSTSSYGFGNPGGTAMTNSFLQHSLGADQVSDSVKSLFPSSSTATAGGHDEYRGSPPDLLSRTTSSQPQELCLTLQSNQHNMFSHVSPNHHGIISGAGVPGWPDHGQRMPSSWHASDNDAGEGRGAGGNGDSYMFAGILARQGLDQGQLFSSNGETLQSSAGWAASARAWLDPLAGIHQPSAMSGQIGFSHLVGGGGGGFLGLRNIQRLLANLKVVVPIASYIPDDSIKAPKSLQPPVTSRQCRGQQKGELNNLKYG